MDLGNFVSMDNVQVFNNHGATSLAEFIREQDNNSGDATGSNLEDTQATNELEPTITDITQLGSMNPSIYPNAFMCDKLVLQFVQFKGRRIVNHKSKTRVISDIVTLGSSLVNRMPSKELDKLFSELHGNETNTMRQDQSVAELIQAFAKLSTCLKMVEQEVLQLKMENNDLTNVNKRVSTPSQCRQMSVNDTATPHIVVITAHLPRIDSKLWRTKATIAMTNLIITL
jgi:hypothetical protein